MTGCQLVAGPGLPWLTAECPGPPDPVGPAALTVIVALVRPATLPVNRGVPPLLEDHDTYVGTHEYLYWLAQSAMTAQFPVYGQLGMARLLPGRSCPATFQKEAVSGREWGSRTPRYQAPT